jgi:nucleotide-binding universal stress UspA family protein
MYRMILIANDGSQGAAAALATAIGTARKWEAALHMICVEELPRFPTSLDQIAEERQEGRRFFERVVEQARRQAKASGVKLEVHVVAGHAVPCIVDFVEKGEFDLLVIGYMGHSAIYNRLIGGTTDRLVELAPCQVLVVK